VGLVLSPTVFRTRLAITALNTHIITRRIQTVPLQALATQTDLMVQVVQNLAIALQIQLVPRAQTKPAIHLIMENIDIT